MPAFGLGLSRLFLQQFVAAAHLRDFRMVGVALDELLQEVQRFVALAFFVYTVTGTHID